MSVELEIDIEGTSALSGDLVQQLVRAAAIDATLDGHVEVGVHFVTPERIRELNNEHRGMDSPTDVLSFPIDGTDPLLPGEPRYLGDLVVCETYVRGQLEQGTQMAPGGDTTLDAALRRCIVHGMLHLLGEDHERGEKDAAAMFQREQALLDRVEAAL